MCDSTSCNLRWVPAPATSPMASGGLNGVFLYPGQRVRWNVTHTLEGTYVNGYTVEDEPDVEEVLEDKS